MGSPINKLISVTSTENTELFGSGVKGILIKNQGATDCIIEFDKAIDSNSYLLEAGETLSLDHPVIRLHFKTASSTTSLYVIVMTNT